MKKKIKKTLRKLKEKFYHLMIAIGTTDIERTRMKLTAYEEKLKNLYEPDAENEKQQENLKKIKSVMYSIARKEFTGHDSYITYLYKRIKINSLWDVSQKVVSVSKQYFVIARALRFIVVLIAFVETSAVLIILFTLTIAILPIILLFFLVSYLAERIRAHKYNTIIEKEIRDKRILVFIAQKDSLKKNSAFVENIKDLSACENNIVFVVTDSYTKFNFTAVKKYSGRVWFLRAGYFFTLQKKFFKARADAVIIW